ncbi:MAG: DUF1684 domain-containing protein [Deltaproteobacteria bacterium]|nr:DUF1684 domain-containing protein [Deltaproteobacteria bacterium]
MMSRDQMERWWGEVEDLRQSKDAFLLRDPSSPIAAEHRRKLKAMPYFPLEERYFFEVVLTKPSKTEVVEIQDTGGRMRKFIRWGHFDFEVDGKPCVLHAYKSERGDENLFVPFRDKSNGKQTYGAGRYLDLYPERDRTNTGWILDLNLAYNPYCAYSEKYVCPFVPPENWLEVEILAGEKATPFHD